VFDEVPEDLLLKLFGYCRPVDLVVCSSTNRGWRKTAQELLSAVTIAEVTGASDKHSLAYLRSCPALQKVRIRGSFTAFSYLSIIPQISHLHVLKLSACSELTNGHVTALLCGLAFLKKLEIDSCPLVTDEAFHDLYEQKLRIDIGEVAGTRLSQLGGIEISNCALVTGKGLKYATMALGSNGLSSFKYANNGGVRNEELQLAARRMQTLSLRNVNSTRLQLTECFSLVEISMHGVGQLHSVTLNAPLLLRAYFTQCKMLLSVHLDSTVLEELSCSGSRTLNVVEVVSTKLQVVNLYGCARISDSVMKGIVEPAQASLTKLDLDALEISALSLRSPNLEHLTLKGCSSLDRVSLTGASSLRDLDCRGCSQLRWVTVDRDCPQSSVRLQGKGVALRIN